MLPVQYILFSDCGSGPIKSVHKRDPLAVAVPAVAYHNLKIKVEPQNVTRGRHMGIPERNPGQEQMCRSRFGSVRIHLYSLSHGPVVHQASGNQICPSSLFLGRVPMALGVAYRHVGR